jgi:membrane associated rhomboid family serine protease
MPSLPPITQALLLVNVGLFALDVLLGGLLTRWFALWPIGFGFLPWQVVSYAFLHGGLIHLLFNMLALWMFGVELERRWGTRGFLRYYAITGVGAGLATVAIALLPFDVTRAIWPATTIGASGAVYGLLLAWALLFPHRQILFMFIFPLPARVAALLMGAMSFLAAVSGSNGSVAEATHLSGFAIGWIYLRGPKNLRLELQYRLTKWRMDRMRRRFNVHKGGRDGDGGWSGRVH